jgi:hypothetical protein
MKKSEKYFEYNDGRKVSLVENECAPEVEKFSLVYQYPNGIAARVLYFASYAEGLNAFEEEKANPTF